MYALTISLLELYLKEIKVPIHKDMFRNTFTSGKKRNK